MTTSRLIRFVSILLLSVVLVLAKANTANAEGECNSVCAPCTTVEKEPVTGCQIQFETSINDFGDTEVRIWGTAPYGAQVIVGREAIYDLYAPSITPLASGMIGSSGLFVTYDYNPPVDQAIVNYYMAVLVDGEVVCEAHIVMNPPVSATTDPSEPSESTSLTAGDTISDSVLITNSGITNTVIVNDSSNVQVNTGDTYSYTYLTETTYISVTYVIAPVKPESEELKPTQDNEKGKISLPPVVRHPKPISGPRDDSDVHDRHNPPLETHPKSDLFEVWNKAFDAWLVGELQGLANFVAFLTLRSRQIVSIFGLGFLAVMGVVTVLYLEWVQRQRINFPR